MWATAILRQVVNIRNVWAVYGGHKSGKVAADRISGLKFFSREIVKSCLINYFVRGWSTYIPKSCRNTIVLLPLKVAPLMWGWPYKFEQRMHNAGRTIIQVNSINGSNSAAVGIDSKSQLQKVPNGFAGRIWTNRIEIIGRNNANNQAASFRGPISPQFRTTIFQLSPTTAKYLQN